MRKNDSALLWAGIAAAAIAAIYFMTNKKTFTASVPGATVNPVQNILSYLKPAGAQAQNVSDVISNLSDTSLPALQLTPPDSQTLQPLNLDLQPDSGTDNSYDV